MKKITCFITIFVVILLPCACDIYYDPQSGLTAEEYIQWEDEQTLGYINETLGTDYESYEHALNEQIRIYEAESSTDNLCKVCFIMFLSPQPPSNDMIIKYYGGLFDKMAQDKETYEYLNNNLDDMFNDKRVLMHNYLAALYESGMKDKFENTASNLELYFSDPADIIVTAGEFFNGFLLNNDDATDEDYRLFLDILLECEKNYADKVDTGQQSYLALQISYCAHKLGETDLAEEYNKKWSELDKALNNGN